MEEINNIISILSFCKEFDEEIKNISLDCYIKEFPFPNSQIIINFKNGNRISIYNESYEINDDYNSIPYKNIETVLEHIKNFNNF